MFNSDRVAALAAASTAAALDPMLWDNFLELASETVGSICTHILRLGPEGQTLGEVAFGYDPKFLETYSEYFAERNVWAPGFSGFGEGQIVDARQMCTDDVLYRSEWYNDWIRPQDDIVLGGGVVVSKGLDGVFCIGGNIPRQAGEKAVEKWLSLLELLTPQLRNSWDISRAITSTRVGGMGSGVLIVRPNRRLVFLSDAAEQYLIKGEVFRIDAKGYLKGETHTVDHWIDNLLLQMVRKPFTSRKVRFRLTDGSSFLLHGTTINSDFVGESWPLPSCSYAGPLLLVTMSKSALIDSSETKLIKRLGLTNAEAQVALALTDGLTTRQIAEQRNVSVYTIRNQLKSAISKSDTRGQSEFAILVTRIIGSH